MKILLTLLTLIIILKIIRYVNMKKFPVIEGTMSDYTIKPNEGFGHITFNSTPSQVIKQLGNQMTYEDWMGGNLNSSFTYPGLMLGFSACNSVEPLPDSKLDEITIYEHKEATLFNKKCADWNKDDMLEYLNNENIKYDSSDFEINIESMNMELLFNQSFQLKIVTIDNI